MLRVILTTLLLGSVAISGVSLASGDYLSQPEAVHKAFSASGAEISGINISGFAELDGVEYSLHELKKQVTRLARNLGLWDRELEFFQEAADQYRLVTATGRTRGASVVIAAQSLKGYPITDHAPVTHFVIRVDRKEPGVIDGPMLYRRVESALRDIGTKPQMTYTLLGTLHGKLGRHEVHELMERIFVSVRAEVVDSFEVGELYSYCGYTRKICDSLDVGGAQVNINAALRYDSYHDLTRINIAAPVLNIPY